MYSSKGASTNTGAYTKPLDRLCTQKKKASSTTLWMGKQSAFVPVTILVLYNSGFFFWICCMKPVVSNGYNLFVVVNKEKR